MSNIRCTHGLQYLTFRFLAASLNRPPKTLQAASSPASSSSSPTPTSYPPFSPLLSSSRAQSWPASYPGTAVCAAAPVSPFQQKRTSRSYRPLQHPRERSRRYPVTARLYRSPAVEGCSVPEIRERQRWRLEERAMEPLCLMREGTREPVWARHMGMVVFGQSTRRWLRGRRRMRARCRWRREGCRMGKRWRKRCTRGG